MKNKSWFDISMIYANEEDHWICSCMSFANSSLSKLEYILYSNDAVIICSLVGGFACSNNFEFYKIEENGLKYVGQLHSSNSNLFDLSLRMRFDSKLDYW